MADQDTIYSARFRGPLQLERGKANTIKCEVWVDGAVSAPSAGTVSVYEPDGTALVDAQSVTISSSVAQYTIGSGSLPTTMDIASGWIAEWSLTMADGLVHDFRTSGALVRRRFQQMVAARDLYDLHEDLNPAYTGTFAASGTTWQAQLNAAFANVIDKMTARGTKPSRVLDAASFRRVMLAEAMVLISAYLDDSPVWAARLVRYERLLRDAWAEVTYTEADPDEVGAIDPDERKSPTGSIWLIGRP